MVEADRRPRQPGRPETAPTRNGYGRNLCQANLLRPDDAHRRRRLRHRSQR